MQRETKYQLTRRAFLPLSLALMVSASAPSWAGQYIEREACEEAAARSNPVPPPCPGRHVLDTYTQTNQRGQETCLVEIVEYVCQGGPDGYAEYFPLPDPSTIAEKILPPEVRFSLPKGKITKTVMIKSPFVTLKGTEVPSSYPMKNGETWQLYFIEYNNLKGESRTAWVYQPTSKRTGKGAKPVPTLRPKHR